MSAGKGDKPRPVDKKQFDKNFEQINWQEKKRDVSNEKCKGGKTSFVYK
jgi:hypothetical protein